MKSILTALFIMLGFSALRAGEVILPYSAFGPQVAAYELIGMEWWQWDSRGDERVRHYPIRVVVYWEQTGEQTAKKYPVDQEKLQDFRYVEYAMAVEHLESTIRKFRVAGVDTERIAQALAHLKKQRADHDTAE